MTLLSVRTWNSLAMDDMDMKSVYSAWGRFKGEGKGYLERMVHATAEHYVKVMINIITKYSARVFARDASNVR